MSENSSENSGIPDDKPLVFSIFGHKPSELGGFDELNPLNKWVKFSLKGLLSHVTKINPNAVFLCGGHPGTEMWGCEELLAIRDKHPERHIKVILVLPFPNLSGRSENGDELGGHHWPMSTHNRLKNIMSRADEVKVLSEGPYSSWRLRSRDEWVILESSGVITVLKSGDTKNPTYYAAKLADKKGIQVCVIDPIKETIRTGLPELEENPNSFGKEDAN